MSAFTMDGAKGSVSMVTRGRRRRRGGTVFGLLVVALATLCFSSVARAEFGVRPGSFVANTIDQNGDDYTQAGGHPYAARFAFEMNLTQDAFGDVPDGLLRDVRIDLPVGFVGNPQATPVCDPPALSGALSDLRACPVGSQVGIVDIVLRFGTMPIPWRVPVYNVKPTANEPAAFAFNVAGVTVNLNAVLQADNNYSLHVDVPGINSSLQIYSVDTQLWGVPASSVHDGDRWDPRNATFGISSPVAPRAFLSNPTDCSAGRLTSTLTVDSHENPGDWRTVSYTTRSPVTGCDSLTFEPTIDVQPDTTQAGAPAGYKIGITVPQNDTPAAIATPSLRDAVVRLPLGTSVSPSSANGLQGCSDEQIGLGSDAPPTCPNGSKIGDVELTTPLLSGPLTGGIYLARQHSDQLLRIYLVMQGYGVMIKLSGDVDPDPVTGQLLATFTDNPALPFSRLELNFKGGSRASLVNPRTCGTATTTASLTPYGAEAATPSSSFEVTGPCPSGFNPSFTGGTQNANAGSDSPFSVTFARGDGDEILKGVTVGTPKGLLARIADVPLCSSGQAATGTCGAASQIGTTTTSAGPGTTPYVLPGRVFLTEGYNGGQFGLSIVVPAVAGPFDLGTVVVRAAIHVDPVTTQLTIASDPLPTILQGIPLLIRSVTVNVDRPGFMFNPTNCSAKSVTGLISSIAGAVASKSTRFQVGNCRTLPFTPKMTLKVGARGKLTSGKRTPLEVTLAMTRGQANNRSVQVTLPLALNARLDVVNKRRACTLEQFRADRCPMKVGEATAVTPLLRDPLKGPAYFVYTPERRLPDLVVRLRGQVDVDLTGKVTIDGLKLRTTFDTIPDVPITKFRLALASGSTNGPIGATRNLCSATTRKALKARLDLIAQSGKRVTKSQKISVAGCGKASRTARRAARRAAKK